MTAKGISIHIGLNHVDPNGYNGWDGALSGCINDANDMKAIADSMGYQSSILIDAQATSDSVTCEIGQAAQQLSSGDILLLTYSGHGGQFDDVNGDEEDAKDETWVLWDRQLLDDELYSLWSQFSAGVRIFMLSDSCHSGTVLRMLRTYNDLVNEAKHSKPGPNDPITLTINMLGDKLGLRDAPSSTNGTRGMPATAAAPGAYASSAAPTATMVRETAVPHRKSARCARSSGLCPPTSRNS